VHAPREGILRKNEHKILIKRSGARPAHEILAAASPARSYRKLRTVKGKEKLLGIGPSTPGVGSAARAARDRYFLTRTRMHFAKLHRTAIPLSTAGNIPVTTDVFLQSLVK